MAFVSRKAWRSRSAERAALAGRLKGEISAALALGEDDALHLNELACPDPGCPDMETVVLVMRAAEPSEPGPASRTAVPDSCAGTPWISAEKRPSQRVPSNGPHSSTRWISRPPGRIAVTTGGSLSSPIACTTSTRTERPAPSPVMDSSATRAPSPPTSATRAGQYASSVNAPCSAAGLVA